MPTEPSKTDPPKGKRRRFQFRLRTLMIGVTLLAVPLGYVGWHERIVQVRRQTTLWVDSVGGQVFAPSENLIKKSGFACEVGWLRRLLGDTEVAQVYLPKFHNVTETDMATLHLVFPNARIELMDPRLWQK
jgi:hypothetical protein